MPAKKLTIISAGVNALKEMLCLGAQAENHSWWSFLLSFLFSLLFAKYLVWRSPNRLCIEVLLLLKFCPDSCYTENVIQFCCSSRGCGVCGEVVCTCLWREVVTKDPPSSTTDITATEGTTEHSASAVPLGLPRVVVAPLEFSSRLLERWDSREDLQTGGEMSSMGTTVHLYDKHPDLASNTRSILLIITSWSSCRRRQRGRWWKGRTFDVFAERSVIVAWSSKGFWRTVDETRNRRLCSLRPECCTMFVSWFGSGDVMPRLF